MVLHKMAFSNLKWRVAQFFELWWWRFYFKNKQKHTYLEWKKKYWESVFKKVESVLHIQPQQQILELGCGPAGCFIFLNKNKITAVDPLLLAYEQKLPFFNPKEYGHVTFVPASIEAASIHHSFDVVLCFNAINHVRDIQLCLKRLYSWVKPGGRVLLSVDAHRHSMLKRVFATIPGDILHPHQYTLQEYETLCSMVGLHKETVVLLKQESIFSHYLLVLSK